MSQDNRNLYEKRNLILNYNHVPQASRASKNIVYKKMGKSKYAMHEMSKKEHGEMNKKKKK